MKEKELLCPVGNFEALKEAIYNGADAVYLGGKKFGARKFANNFNNEEMIEAIKFVHFYHKKIYVTVNTLLFNDEIDECLEYIKFLHENDIDAVIMQDIGLIELVHSKFPDLEIHASTQCHNHNIENINFMKSLGVKRVILAREVSLDQINKWDTDVDLEIFVQGALCVSYSGCCLFSSLNGTRSGNRGECVGSCRLPYKLTDGTNIYETEGDYLLSLKDLCSLEHLKEILDSKVVSLKIEGRMKSPEYVGYVTRLYRTIIDTYYKTGEINYSLNDILNLKKLFNREFTKGYLFNENSKNIANIKSSNHIGVYLGEIIEITPKKVKIKLDMDLNMEDGIRFPDNTGMIVNMLYDTRGLLTKKVLKGNICYVDNKTNVKKKGKVLKTIDKVLMDSLKNPTPLKVKIDFLIDAYKNKPLKVKVYNEYKSLEKEYDIVQTSINHPITSKNIQEQFLKTNNYNYEVDNIEINMDNDIFISLKYLNEVRRDILDNFNLNENKEIKELEGLKIKKYEKDNYKISVLVRNEEQLKSVLDLNLLIYVTDYQLYLKYKRKNVYYRLERVMNYFPNYDNENLLICETGSIKYAQNNNVISDYYLNVTNDYTINLLASKGVKKITLSLENDIDKINMLHLDNFDTEVIVYGKPELMITKYCLLNKCLNTNEKCNVCQKNNYYLKDNDKLYPIRTKNCLNHIFHYKNIDLINQVKKIVNVNTFRIELFEETSEEVIKIVERLKKEIGI